MSKYAGMLANRICPDGGVVRVTMVSKVGQGNDGTSLPCKGCYVQAADANTDVVRMNIGVAATDSLGIDLGRPYISGTTASGACQPLWVPIDDVAKLYFHCEGDTTADVDILFLKG